VKQHPSAAICLDEGKARLSDMLSSLQALQLCRQGELASTHSSAKEPAMEINQVFQLVTQRKNDLKLQQKFRSSLEGNCLPHFSLETVTL